MTADTQAKAPVRVGVSACLLGEAVRYDGGHKEDRFLTGTLAQFVELVAVCPEVEVGMTTPRETVRLVRGADGGTRMLASASGTDHTASMRRFAKRRARELESLGLCGYVFKERSPSCGLARVKVYASDGKHEETGRGLFAEALLARLPHLPVEEEGRLGDPRAREGFVTRIFAYRRLQDLFAGRWRVNDLVRFHAGEALLLMAHDPKGRRRLDALVASARGRPRAELSEDYSRAYTESLRKRATPKKHAKVLMRILSQLERFIAPEERHALSESIEDCLQEQAPRVVPLALLRHCARLHGVGALLEQVYLQPHPGELLLQNHA